MQRLWEAWCALLRDVTHVKYNQSSINQTYNMDEGGILMGHS